MLSSSFIKKLKWMIVFFIIYTIIFISIFSTLSYTAPFIIAILIALWTYPFKNYLEKKFKMSNSTSAIITTLIFFAIIFSLVSFLVYKITIETRDLVYSIPKFSVTDYNIQNYIDKYKPYYDKIDPTLSVKIEQQISSSLSSLVNITQKLFKWLIAFAMQLPIIFMIVFITLLATYFFLRDMTKMKNKILSIFSTDGKSKFRKISYESNRMFSGYLKSYLIIITLTFVETLIGFSLLHVNYTVILSIICAIFDILPILGIGGIYIPLSIIYLFMGNYFNAITIFLLYIIVSVIRQIVEPKIVSSSLGLHPVSVLAAIFIGIKVKGLTGMIFLIFLMVFYKIFTNYTDDTIEVKDK